MEQYGLDDLAASAEAVLAGLGPLAAGLAGLAVEASRSVTLDAMEVLVTGRGRELLRGLVQLALDGQAPDWLPDGSGFVYQNLKNPKDPYSGQVLFHRLGTPPASGKSWTRPISKSPTIGICSTLGLNNSPLAFDDSASQSRTIAAQNTDIMTHVVLSTPPNKTVEKTGTIHRSTKIAELRRDETSPIATFSIRLIGRVVSCVSFIILEPLYRNIVEREFAVGPA